MVPALVEQSHLADRQSPEGTVLAHGLNSEQLTFPLQTGRRHGLIDGLCLFTWKANELTGSDTRAGNAPDAW